MEKINSKLLDRFIKYLQKASKSATYAKVKNQIIIAGISDKKFEQCVRSFIKNSNEDITLVYKLESSTELITLQYGERGYRRVDESSLSDMIDSYNKNYSDDAVRSRVNTRIKELDAVSSSDIDIRKDINDYVDGLNRVIKLDKDDIGRIKKKTESNVKSEMRDVLMEILKPDKIDRLDDIDIKSLIRTYEAWYDKLYNGGIVADKDIVKFAIKAENFIDKNRNFYRKFCSKYGDALSSDRELASFIMAISEFGVLTESARARVCEGKKKDGTLWTSEEVMSLLETNDKVLYGALKHLYACQTDDEQRSDSTKEHNGRGFNAYDAEFLTSVCKQLIQRGSLSEKQKEVARKKLKKYKTQLTNLANS